MMARMLTQLPCRCCPRVPSGDRPGGRVGGPRRTAAAGLGCTGWPRSRGTRGTRRRGGWRRCSCVQLKAASQAQVAVAFGVIPLTLWRWEQALAAGGVAALIPDRKGPQRPSKLTPQLVAQIRELDGQGVRKAAVAAAAGVSETSVRNVLRAAAVAGRRRRRRRGRRGAR